MNNLKLAGLFVGTLLCLLLLAITWFFDKACASFHGYGKELDREAFEKEGAPK